jgi:hypothetical protein
MVSLVFSQKGFLEKDNKKELQELISILFLGFWEKDFRKGF